MENATISVKGLHQELGRNVSGDVFYAEMLKRLLNINSHSALTLAAYNGHLDIVQYLLANGADKNAMSNVVTKKGETALDVVRKKKFNEILDVLS